MLGDNSIDGRLEDFVDTRHFLGRTLHVKGAHLLGHSLALGNGDGGETLRFQEIDTCALVTEIGFQAAEDDGSLRAEVEDFGVPLWRKRVSDVS